MYGFYKAYLILYILTSIFLIPALGYGSECHAVLRIRADENRPAHYAIDGCMANPIDDSYADSVLSRVPNTQGMVIIFEQCNSCCMARAENCYGYITGNWIDPEKKTKPKGIFDLLKVEWSNQSQERECDCICLEKNDIDDEMDRRYDSLKLKIQHDQYPVIFNMLDDIVKLWNSVPSFIKRCD